MLINTKQGFLTCSRSSRRTLPSPRQPTDTINSGESIMATLTMTYPAYVSYDSTMKLLPNEYHTGNGTESCRSYVNLTDHYRHSNVVATSSNSTRNGNPFNNSSNTNSSCLADTNKSSFFINCNDYRSHSAEEALFRPSSNRLRQCYNRQGSRSFEQLSSGTTPNNQNNDNNKNNDIFIRERKRESEKPAISSTVTNAQTNTKNQQPTKKKLPHNVTFIKNLNELKMCGFYYENINRDDSKKLLSSERPGTFLLRDSSSNSSYFTLSYVNQVNDVKHLRIEYSMGQFYFYTESSSPLTSTKKSDTVLGLVELYSHKKSSTIIKTNGATTTLDSTNTDINNINRTDVINSEGDDIARNHNTILKKPYKVSTQTLKEICRITINRENLTGNINNNNCIDERLNSYLRLYPYKL